VRAFTAIAIQSPTAAERHDHWPQSMVGALAGAAKRTRGFALGERCCPCRQLDTLQDRNRRGIGQNEVARRVFVAGAFAEQQ